MNWYNNDIRVYLRDKQWPKGYVPTIKSEPEGLIFILSQKDLESYNMDVVDYRQLEKVVGESVEWVRSTGCPCYVRAVYDNG